MCVLVPLVLALVIVPARPSQAQAGADLSGTLTWQGRGAPRARVGQAVSYAFTVTNLGPEDATNVSVTTDGSDHFDGVLQEFSFGTIAAGGSVTGSLTTYVCCFPKGESRLAFVDLWVRSDTPDPNGQNNWSTVDTRIIGRHGEWTRGPDPSSSTSVGSVSSTGTGRRARSPSC